MLFPFWNIIRPTSYDAKPKPTSKRMTFQATTRRPPTLLVSSFFSQFTSRERDNTLDKSQIPERNTTLNAELSGLEIGFVEETQSILRNPFLNDNAVALGCTHGNSTGKSNWSSCLTKEHPMVYFYSSPVNCLGGVVRQLDEKEFQSEQLKEILQVYGTNDAEICRRNILFDSTRQPHPENENMVIYPTLPENHPLQRPLPCGNYHVACNVTEQEGNWSLYVDDPLFDMPLECGNGKTSYHEVNLPCPRDDGDHFLSDR